MHAENSVRRVRASQSSVEASSSSSFSSKRNSVLHSGIMVRPRDENRVRKDRHDTAKDWRDVRDQLRDHVVFHYELHFGGMKSTCCVRQMFSRRESRE